MKQVLDRISVGMLCAVIALLVVLPNCGAEENSRIKAPGIVDGEIISLTSQVAGTVETIAPKEGETIAKSALIANVNSDKIRTQLKELEISLKEIVVNREKLKKQMVLVNATLGYTTKQVNRFRKLKKSRSISGEKLESMELKKLEAETTRFTLQKSLETLEMQEEKIRVKQEYLNLLLQDHSIHSPVAGLVLETFAEVGENVFPGAAVADILDTSSLYVEVFIEEGEIAHLKLNQKVRILMDGLDQEDLSGVITYFGKKAEFSPKYIVSEKERKALLYKVKVKISKNTHHFKIGMPVTVIFGE